MPGNNIKIAVGPVAFYWQKKELLDFYATLAESKADIIYLGETVCSKRRALRGEEWLELAQHLQNAGKEVVLSTLTLIEAESELHATKRLVENGIFLVECNDIAAAHYAIDKKIAFMTGPAINIYNHHTLRFFIDKGLVRWVPSVEQSRAQVADTLKNIPLHCIETEIVSYGFLPLAYSARCFTARQYQYPKDQCQFICGQHPQGIALHTQEGTPLFRINGIQTQSFQPCNLLPLIADMQTMGVYSMRVNLSGTNDIRVIEQLDTLRQQQQNTIALLDTHGVNGFWYGQAGMLENA